MSKALIPIKSNSEGQRTLCQIILSSYSSPSSSSSSPSFSYSSSSSSSSSSSRILTTLQLMSAYLGRNTWVKRAWWETRVRGQGVE
ncbi:hypothetical protein E2C01_026602 [Portunus trituberculatus]|uniref:Uncharacterized protein n=1 Tax=Portunus trituberculatus TaxID=210409 RepID=A0A5B7EIS1_PORTR|nr:hypothetical protein [Portunus trituberculatus]